MHSVSFVAYGSSCNVISSLLTVALTMTVKVHTCGLHQYETLERRLHGCQQVLNETVALDCNCELDIARPKIFPHNVLLLLAAIFGINVASVA